MREIKFRGRKIDTGEWVYGYLVVDESGETNIVNNYGTSYSWDEVDPETVGQYTGLQDCKRTKEYPNGQEIYEGDIVTGKRESHWHGGYDKVNAKVIFSDSTLSFRVDGLGGGPLHDIEDIEVIGNV